jgi:hypothetical protein
MDSESNNDKPTDQERRTSFQYLISIFSFFKLGIKLSLENIDYYTIMIYLQTFIGSYFLYHIPLLYGQIVESIGKKGERSIIELLITWYVTLKFGEFFIKRLFWAVTRTSSTVKSKNKLRFFKKILE